MRSLILLVTLLFTLSLTAAPVVAQGRGQGQAKRAETTAAAGGKTAKAPKTPKTKTASAPKAKGSAKVKAVKTKTPKSTATSTTNTTSTTNATSTTNSTSTTTTVTTVTATTPTTRKVKNPKLEARLQKLLPTGTNVQDAASGFKNWGQFVAATHVSQNLGIPFAELKAQM